MGCEWLAPRGAENCLFAYSAVFRPVGVALGILFPRNAPKSSYRKYLVESRAGPPKGSKKGRLAFVPDLPFF